MISPQQIKLAIAAAVVAGAFGAGYKVAAWKYGEQLAELRRSYAKAAQRAANKALADSLTLSRASSERAALAAELDAERVKKQTVITREVIKYVQSPDTGHCAIGIDFVCIHNAAAGVMPGSECAAGSGSGQVGNTTE